MFSKARLLTAVALGLTLAGPVSAQIESSGLGDLNPWGASLLDRGEDALPDGLWSSSSSEYLLALMERIDPQTLSPAERDLLSRALRSPSAAPEGDLGPAMQAERLRLLMALGERDAAATLADQLNEAPEEIDAAAILADARLARGGTDVVCRQMNPGADGRFWSELRAVCALAAGEMGTAELSIEIAAQEEGAEPWFANTAIAVLGGMPERPAARYGSGLEIALSDLAELEPDAESLSAARPDLAALIAMDETRPLGLRIAAAGLAARNGELGADRHRALYETLIATDGFEPENAIETAFVMLAMEPEPVVPDLVETPAAPQGPRDLRSVNEEVIEPVETEEVDADPLEPEDVHQITLVEEQAMALAEALRQTSADAGAFKATSRLFEADLETLPANEDTSDQAIIFARAALAARNDALALNWLEVADTASLSDAERFEAAYVIGHTLIIADGAEAADLRDVAMRLLETSIEPSQQAATWRLFSAWAGFDLTVPAEARAALAQSELDNRRIGPGTLAAIKAAAQADASGEALLTLLTQTDGQAETLSGADLTTLIQVLRDMNAGAEAQSIVLDTAGLW